MYCTIRYPDGLEGPPFLFRRQDDAYCIYIYTYTYTNTHQGRFTRVVQVQQVAVQEDVAVAADLHRGVGRRADEGARREGHVGEDAKGGDADLGQALGGEVPLVGAAEDDLLDRGVGGLVPVWFQRGRHD